MRHVTNLPSNHALMQDLTPFHFDPVSLLRQRVIMHYVCNTSEGSDVNEATFTFRVDEVLKAEFSTAAKARDRSAAQLLRDFMREFVQQQQEAADHDAWFRRQVQAGLDSANAGRLMPAAEVEAKFAARRAATRRRLEASE